VPFALKGDPIPEQKLATALSAAALEKKATDLVILDVRGLVDYSDIFVLCSARNVRQTRAIADALRKTAREEFNIVPRGLEGQGTGRWMLVDFGEVIFHVFEESMRGFYNLDGLWRDAPQLPVPDVQPVEEADTLFSL
jgi:ribosome silencing factor RsfS/YbeB/iojap